MTLRWAIISSWKKPLFGPASILLALALSIPAQAASLERFLPLKADFQRNNVQIQEGTILRLHNDWNTRLRKTTITDVNSGLRMAQIERIESGQTVNLEFSRIGAYTVCYFSGPLKIETQRCHKIHVVPVTAT